MKQMMCKRFFMMVIFLNGLLPLFAQRQLFNENWLFKVDTSNHLNDEALVNIPWRSVTLPHDWSIEQPFDKASPSGNRGAALRGGLGLYEKRFVLENKDRGKKVFIIFDGVYMNSTVTINGHTLGNRPFGYISFEYDMTPFLKFDGQQNILRVRAENKQPNSRWYSGSGIYRNVWLDIKGRAYVKNWGTFITTPEIGATKALVNMQTRVMVETAKPAQLKTEIFDPKGNLVQSAIKDILTTGGAAELTQQFLVPNPQLWDIETPVLYKAISSVLVGDAILHQYTTHFGIRYFKFDQQKGFFLNGRPVKIMGANMHHDLGALGAAINVRAMERQLQMIKEMGFNGIRTSHNPPAPEWLDLCDKMGFIVMNETFDVWAEIKENTPFNYNQYFEKWHYRDIADHVTRDRNHPSVFIWSIGNEIPEQHGTGRDTAGRTITRTLTRMVKEFDTTRPVTAGMNFTNNSNNMYQANVLDLVGVNYHHKEWKDLGTTLFPSNKPYLITESVSALATRGAYDMPSDSIRRWAGFTDQKPGGNADFTCSAYENCSAPWASTNEESLKLLLKYPYLSGMYMWTGFDYLGEPTPYPFPARSSYFGVIDLAGFPKDGFYLYKSIFSKETVLHILPHWNWNPGQVVDVHVYFNNADVVELYLNGKLLAKKSKQGDDLFVRFNGIRFMPGTLKAISKKGGRKVMEQVVKTAGAPYKFVATADRSTIKGDGQDLCFVKVAVVDKAGNMVPSAHNDIRFSISGAGSIAALDNGSPTDLEPFSNKNHRKAFNGLALAMIRPAKESGEIVLNIDSENLKGATLKIVVE